MKLEEQRIAIAEACGWKFYPSHDVYGPGGHELVARPEEWRLETADGDELIAYGDKWLPDYLNDLNAMHEAEKEIWSVQQQWDKYKSILLSGHDDDAIHTTAAQRAEAFLRTIGKWKE